MICKSAGPSSSSSNTQHHAGHKSPYMGPTMSGDKAVFIFLTLTTVFEGMAIF
ncbi:hypothetical protein SCLCIDRAFT_1218570 [Scleroderma citrinum Foug A]|uniref:Uncharacterized protein n=1 Tax=Scleroderma citrinum Foug A TaxID=1036808 RepID=A0A0C3A1T1_9AGAM|nr:hypothetical protein SCLCIDRAFT_1218570 [Scleroderma citrinum Foug A]